MRTFITASDVDVAAAGSKVIEVDDSVTVTAYARERAVDRGVTFVPLGSRDTAGPGASDDDLARAVKTAVVASLGYTPDRLDDIVNAILAGRTGEGH